jgi:hypothetical protein
VTRITSSLPSLLCRSNISVADTAPSASAAAAAADRAAAGDNADAAGAVDGAGPAAPLAAAGFAAPGEGGGAPAPVVQPPRALHPALQALQRPVPQPGAPVPLAAGAGGVPVGATGGVRAAINRGLAGISPLDHAGPRAATPTSPSPEAAFLFGRPLSEQEPAVRRALQSFPRFAVVVGEPDVAVQVDPMRSAGEVRRITTVIYCHSRLCSY